MASRVGFAVAVGLGSSGFGRTPNSIIKTTSTNANNATPAPRLPQPVDFLGCTAGTAIGLAEVPDRLEDELLRLLTEFG